MKKNIIVFLMCSMLFITINAEEQINILNSKNKKPFSVGVNAGLLGVGINLSLPLDNDLSFRLNLNKFTYNLNKKYKKVDFSGDLNIFNLGALVDYFPSNNFFRFTAGAYLNKNKITAVSQFTKTITVKIYNTKQKFTDHVVIDSEAKFDNISPYFGLGFGHKIEKKGWNTTFDMGVLYQGLPTLTYNTTTNYELTKQRVERDIEKEKKRVEKFAKKYRFYPVVSVGISYSF